MIGKTVSHYRILSELGSGGMGTVYKARDIKLDRFVALKFPPPHFSQAEKESKRFIREARAASALDHPNICTIHEIDETEDGQMFIAMACYDGKSLKERIERGPLPIKEVIEIALQIAQGLAEAHSKEIVHRDIKPANILLTRDGTVKIVDFGLAKLAGQTVLTGKGTILGTVAYMSPEQARGAEVDHRTDIWSLGVVIYEMLTGKRPFTGDNGQAVIFSILNNEPRPVHDLREDVADELGHIVHKALAKESAARHTSLGELLQGLRALAHAPRSGVPAKAIPAIAVLPFANMSADPEQEYFCDGMAEEIINALMHVEGLRVAARTSAFAFKGRQEDIREIGRNLSVASVLEGSVRRAGTRLRITVQLIDVTDGYNLWSERYDREMEDVFAIQDEISRAIVSALKIRLQVAQQKPLVKRATENLEAYDDYLRAIYCYKLRTRKDNEQAIQLLERATDLDSGFTLAFAALAFACVDQFFAYEPLRTWEQKAFVAIEKALAFDPELAEVHMAKGLLLWTESHHFPHEQAMLEFRRAIALKPNLAEAHTELARVLWHVGRTDEAYDALEKALQIDPADIKAQFRMGYLQMQRGNYASALSYLRMHPPESNAEWVKALMAMCLWYLERKKEARAMMRQANQDFPEDPTVLSLNAILLADAGSEKEAVAKIELAIEKGKHLGHFHHIANHTAAVYAIMNKKKLALDWLEETAEDGFPCYPWFEIDPCLENIRNEPRFVKLMEELRNKWGDLKVE